MRKKFALSILTLTTVISGAVVFDASSVSAKEIKNGISYWSVPEMLEFKTVVEKEQVAACGDDYRCRQDWFYEHLEGSSQYRALETFQMDKMIPTSINPSTDTIKLFYQNEDTMLAYMLGRPQTSSIEDFYLLWVEEWLGNPFKNGSWLVYGERYPYFLGEKETVESASHLLIDENKATKGEKWFTPNVEREYQISGGNIKNNTRGMFYYSLKEDNGGRTNGIKDYRSCFDADYQEGMECRFMYGEDGSSRYFPFLTTEPEESTSPSTSETNNEPSNEPSNATPTPTTEDSAGSTDVGKISTDDTDSKTNAKTEKTTEAIVKTVVSTNETNPLLATSKPVIIQVDKKTGQAKSQNTGTINSSTNSTSTEKSTDSTGSDKSTEKTEPLASTSSVELPKSGKCEREIIFPWWFIILVAVCDAIIMCFFWPKKSEKRLDKEGNMR